MTNLTEGYGMPDADPVPGRTTAWYPAQSEVFGPYRLDDVLGRGGMGEVFRAFDTRRNRVVAVKRMARHLAFDPEYRKRFQRESALAARLREPHIIPIHDFGEIDGRLYIDMRLVEGTSLATMLKRRILGVERVLDVISQIADALDAAHAEDLVHRDVKPSNILLVEGPDGDAATRGFVYLADFGVAATLGGSTLSRPGIATGTATYMAPERMIDDAWDHRIDVYSLACVLYESLTGQHPFAAKDLLELLQAHMNFPPPRPSDLRRNLPAGLDDVIAKGMAKKPEDRYPTAGELALAALNALDTDPGLPLPAANGTPPTETDVTELGRIRETEHGPRRPDPVPPVAVPGAVGTAAVAPTETIAPAASTTVIAPGGAPPPGLPAAVEGPTVEFLLRVPQAPAPPEERSRTPRAVVAIAAFVVVALAVVATVLLVWPPVPPVRFTVVDSAQIGDRPAEIALSPDGTRAYMTSMGTDTVSVVDTETLTVIGQPIPVGDQPNTVLVHPDGSRVYITNTGSNTVSVIDTTLAKVVATIPVGVLPDGLALNAKARRLFVGNGKSDSVSVIDTDTNKVIGQPIPVGDGPFGLAISRDGARLYVPAKDADIISVIDTLTLDTVGTIPVGGGPLGIAVSPDDSRLYVTSQKGVGVTVIDTVALRVLGDPIQVGGAPTGIAISEDGTRVFVTAMDSDTVTVITTADLSAGVPIPAGDAPVHVTVSPDGQRIYIASERSNTLTVLSATG